MHRNKGNPLLLFNETSANVTRGGEVPDFCFHNSVSNRSEKQNSSPSKNGLDGGGNCGQKSTLESEERISVEVCSWMLSSAEDREHWWHS